MVLFVYMLVNLTSNKKREGRVRQRVENTGWKRSTETMRRSGIPLIWYLVVLGMNRDMEPFTTVNKRQK